MLFNLCFDNWKSFQVQLRTTDVYITSGLRMSLREISWNLCSLSKNNEISFTFILPESFSWCATSSICFINYEGSIMFMCQIIKLWNKLVWGSISCLPACWFNKNSCNRHTCFFLLFKGITHIFENFTFISLFWEINNRPSNRSNWHLWMCKLSENEWVSMMSALKAKTSKFVISSTFCHSFIDSKLSCMSSFN